MSNWWISGCCSRIITQQMEVRIRWFVKYKWIIDKNEMDSRMICMQMRPAVRFCEVTRSSSASSTQRYCFL